MKRKVIATMLAATLALSLAGCGDLQVHLIHLSHQVLQRAAQLTKTNHCAGSTVRPSNSSTGELDQEALNFNKDTYYVGFDANHVLNSGSDGCRLYQS